ncbi:MAG: hypothetical protein CMI52_02500 [Parcubacteria group bacterium]|nr:hypothetical protein [Parcubacteria group bacterium]|tara:strand:+ start:177 stop:794 length:618 start_codon:yes stop_codon:yes gene_type:complete
MTENRISFLARLTPFLAPSEVRRVELAYILAKEAHNKDVRKEVDELGAPIRYFEHARHVAIILIDEAGCMNADEICAALLHDTLEDTHLSAEIIEQFLGSRVCRMVLQLSKLPKEGYYERLLARSSWQVMRIKMCDRLHNLRTLPLDDSAFVTKQFSETRREFTPLFERCSRLIPESCRPTFDAFTKIFWGQNDSLTPIVAQHAA